MLDQAARSDLPLVEVDDLHVRFFDGDETVWAVNGASFELMPGEGLFIIGESRSVKSVTMRALMRLLPGRRSVISGRIRVGQFDIMALDERRMSAIRGSPGSNDFHQPIHALYPVLSFGL